MKEERREKEWAGADKTRTTMCRRKGLLPGVTKKKCEGNVLSSDIAKRNRRAQAKGSGVRERRKKIRVGNTGKKKHKATLWTLRKGKVKKPIKDRGRGWGQGGLTANVHK